MIHIPKHYSSRKSGSLLIEVLCALAILMSSASVIAYGLSMFHNSMRDCKQKLAAIQCAVYLAEQYQAGTLSKNHTLNNGFKYVLNYHTSINKYYEQLTIIVTWSTTCNAPMQYHLVTGKVRNV